VIDQLAASSSVSCACGTCWVAPDVVAQITAVTVRAAKTNFFMGLTQRDELADFIHRWIAWWLRLRDEPDAGGNGQSGENEHRHWCSPPSALLVLADGRRLRQMSTPRSEALHTRSSWSQRVDRLLEFVDGRSPPKGTPAKALSGWSLRERLSNEKGRQSRPFPYQAVTDGLAVALIRREQPGALALIGDVGVDHRLTALPRTLQRSLDTPVD